MKGLIAGSSGLVGKNCVRLLLFQNKLVISSLDLYGRKRPEPNERLNFVATDFQTFPNDLSNDMDFAICALGTTIQKAGSSEAFRKVDYHFVINFAKHARARGAKKMILISALGANEDSKYLYNYIKGKTERDLEKIGFESLVILRPSLLLGEREEFRFAEKIATTLEPIYRCFLQGPLRKYRPIHAGNVAAAVCRKILDQTKQVEVIENEEISKLV